jgi:hypothetical protein
MDNRYLRERLEGLREALQAAWDDYGIRKGELSATTLDKMEKSLLASVSAPAVTPRKCGHEHPLLNSECPHCNPIQPAPPVEARADTFEDWWEAQESGWVRGWASKEMAKVTWQAAERETMERLLRLVDETSLTGAVKNEIHYLSKRALAQETPAKEPMGTCSLVSRPHPQSSCGKAWRPLEKKS